jgi:hypothetical protein
LDDVLARRGRLLCHQFRESGEAFSESIFDHALQGRRRTRTPLTRAREANPDTSVLYPEEVQLSPVRLEVWVDVFQGALDLRPLVVFREVVHFQQGVDDRVLRDLLYGPQAAEADDEIEYSSQSLPVQNVYAFEEGEDLFACLLVLYLLHPFDSSAEPLQ